MYIAVSSFKDFFTLAIYITINMYFSLKSIFKIDQNEWYSNFKKYFIIIRYG